MAKRAAEASLWDLHKETIHDLYMEKEKPLKEVIEILGTQHNFKRTYVHSIQQYKLLLNLFQESPIRT